jgi:peroxiredoxin
MLRNFAFTLLALVAASSTPARGVEIAAAPDKIAPILLGTPLPDAELRTLQGEPTTLRAAVAGKPAVIVFYRGGWCPYCNLQLSELRHIEKDVQALGFELIALSPDRPEELRKTLDKHQLGYTLLSDHTAAASQALGIAYRYSDAMLAKYKGYGIDLEQSAGATHHVLPVPAVFVVDAAGVIQFSYAHPDYRVRIPADVVLSAVRAIAAGSHHVKPKT